MPDTASLETAFATVLTSVSSRQGVFLPQNKRYWQGKKTPATMPDGSSALSTDATAKITSESLDYKNMGVVLPRKMPMQIWIDTYDGSQGKGFVLCASVKTATGILLRKQNVGPESWRDMNWTLVSSDSFNGKPTS